MKNFKLSTFSAAIFVVSLFAGMANLQAQSEKEILNIEDVELWRNHSLTLSDDGKWYTVLYSLIEKPEQKKGTKKDSTDSNLIDYKTYGEDIGSDTLYIINSAGGVKYRIANATNPQFSASSKWIAYRIKPKPEDEEKEKEKSKSIIELKNLSSGTSRQYESNAQFQFTEDGNYFISSSNNSLLIYDLENQREHFIGNIGEFIIDKKSKFIAYTISTDDKRGNGVYLYNPGTTTTRALETGNFIYSDLSWNTKKNSLAAIKYNLVRKEIDAEKMSISVFTGIGSNNTESAEYKLNEVDGLPENMRLVVKSSGRFGNIRWSNDDERLFLNICENEPKEKADQKNDKNNDEDPTVNVWHWKDEKLLSQRMIEADRNRKEIYNTVFCLESNSIIQLTNKEIQGLRTSRNTDQWAIGTDNRAYISDWDVRKNDLYRINLINGEKKLIEKQYSGIIEISPDGEKLILWKEGHFWHYDFEDDMESNISSGVDVSFINQANDHWGSQPSYGFVCWVKDENAVIVNHKLDLWVLPLDTRKKARNLTETLTDTDSIRFRVDDMSFISKSEIDERYIDLDTPIILSAFNIQTKHAGFFQLNKQKLKKLIYEPASFPGSFRGSGITKSKESDVIIYKKGDYMNYPEAYLSDIGFSKSKKITNTNPHQENYIWGRRILIDYTNDDGVPLQGILSIPDTYSAGQKLPMIVYSYEKMSQNTFSYASPRLSGTSICEMMYVSDGYLVLQPDIHFNVGTPHSDMHECIDAAIEKVMELGYVDEEYIGYEGFSYGGHCGMYISTQENKFAAIAAGAGVSNLVQGFNVDIVRDGSNEQDYYMTGQGRLGTDPLSNTQMYISESAVFNANTMNTPLLLFHGTLDYVVQWEHSFGFYSILRYLKKPVVFLSYHGEGHGLRKKANRIDIQKRLKEYFDHFLKGKDAGEWITDGIPYQAKKSSTNKEAKESKSTLPKWK